MNKVVIGVVVIIIIAIGAWYVLGAQKAEAPTTSGYAWQFTELPESATAPDMPRTGVVLEAAGKTYVVGEFDGSCFVIEESEWELVEGEKSGVICWWAGGGSEVGIFEESGKIAVKVGQLDEGTAEGGGIRGNFQLLFEI
ncbi:hypothetical protein HYW59_04790 [Candidatus Kaiserbacteria bacterium]|nr:hypothetical protein [Candidatus Kaiserbacteria bacterium]